MGNRDGKIFSVPIEQQQSGNVEPATEVFAKIMIEEPQVAAAPAPAPPVAPAAAAPVRRPPKSLSRRLARRILGPTLMTRRD